MTQENKINVIFSDEEEINIDNLADPKKEKI